MGLISRRWQPAAPLLLLSFRVLALPLLFEDTDSWSAGATSQHDAACGADSSCAAILASRLHLWRKQRDSRYPGYEAQVAETKGAPSMASEEVGALRAAQQGGAGNDEARSARLQKWRRTRRRLEGSEASHTVHSRQAKSGHEGKPRQHHGAAGGPLQGVNVIFDGIMFKIHGGRMFGINKMW